MSPSVSESRGIAHALVVKRLNDAFQRPRDGLALIRELQSLGRLRDIGESAPDRSRAALGSPEIRLHSLVLAVTAELIGSDIQALRADREVAHLDVRRALEETLLRLGGHPCFFPDGSLLLTLAPMDSAHDQAALAARCALLIRSRWPAAQVAVATGKGQLAAQAIIGEVVDHAAELVREAPRRLRENAQLAAASGSIWVDALSASLLERRFDVLRFEGGGLLTGESTSIDTVLPVLGTRPPCLGREPDLAILEATLAHCRIESQSQAILITAAAGIGKTRLRQEFVLRARRRSQPPTVLVGLGQLLSAGAPYSLLSSGLRRLCGIEAVGSPSLEMQRLRQSCTELLGASEGEKIAPFLARLCGIWRADSDIPELRAANNDPRIMSLHILESLTAFLRAWCERNPLLWIFDDLHWGDALSVELLASLLRALDACPFMVLALGRPEVKQLFPTVREWPNVKEWQLVGLSRSASERLIRFVCGDTLERATVSRMVQQAEGNPLLLEELIRAAAHKDGAEPLSTVLAILQARLQQLAAPARMMLVRASVFGDRFWREGLLAMSGAGSEEEVDAALQQLTKAELIATLPQSRHPDDVELCFRHALLREAAYSLLSEEQRRAWHTCAAEYLLRVGKSDALSLAEHLSRGREPARAARYFCAAAEHLLEGNDLAGARSCVERGLACQTLPHDVHDPERSIRGELLGIYAMVLYRSMELAASLEMGESALQLMTQGSRGWCLTFYALFSAAMMLGRREMLRELADRFLTVQPQASAMAAYAESGGVLLSTFSLVGERAASRRIFSRMEQMLRAAGQQDPVSEAWLRFGQQQLVRLLEGEPAQAWSAGRSAAMAAAQTQNRRWIGLMEASAALSEAELGMVSGEARLRAATKLLSQLSGESTYGYAAGWLALVLSGSREHVPEALRLAEGVLAQYQRSAVFSGMAQLALARGHLCTGAVVAAEAAARSAVQLLASTPPLQLGAYAQLVTVLLARGETEQARAIAKESLHKLHALGGSGWMDLAVRLADIEAELAAGETQSALLRLGEAVGILRIRAEHIPDAAQRQGYLENVPENARLLALSRQHLQEQTEPAART